MIKSIKKKKKKLKEIKQKIPQYERKNNQRSMDINSGLPFIGAKRNRTKGSSNCLDDNDSLLNFEKIKQTVSSPYSLKSFYQKNRNNDNYSNERVKKDNAQNNENNICQIEDNTIDNQADIKKCFNINPIKPVILSPIHSREGNKKEENVENLQNSQMVNISIFKEENACCHYCNIAHSLDNYLLCEQCGDNNCIKCIQQFYEREYSKVDMKTINFGKDFQSWKCLKCIDKYKCQKCVLFTHTNKTKVKKKNEKNKETLKAHEKKKNLNIIRINMNDINFEDKNEISFQNSNKRFTEIDSNNERQSENANSTLIVKNEYSLNETYMSLIIRNKQKCENYYMFKCTSGVIKKECLLCLTQRFHPSELLRFKSYGSFMMYLQYIYQTSDNTISYNKNFFDVNKKKFNSFSNKNLIKKGDLILFTQSKTLCKLCFMKVINSKGSIKYLLKIFNEKKQKSLAQIQDNSKNEQKENNQIILPQENFGKIIKEIIPKIGVFHNSEIIEFETTKLMKEQIKTDNQLNNNQRLSFVSPNDHGCNNLNTGITNQLNQPNESVLQLSNSSQISSINNNPNLDFFKNFYSENLPQQNSFFYMQNNSFLTYPIQCNKLQERMRQNNSSIEMSLNNSINYSLYNTILSQQSLKKSNANFNNNLILVFEEVINGVSSNIFELQTIILKYNNNLNSYYMYQSIFTQLKKTYDIICNYLSLLNNYKLNMCNMDRYINQVEEYISYNCSSSDEIKDIHKRFIIEYQNNLKLYQQYEELFHKYFIMFNKTNNFFQQQKMKIEKMNMNKY